MMTKLNKEEFKSRLDKQVYDKYYQDIECVDFKGYSGSDKTWENIKDLVSWKKKKVVDLGCFHGYFCFKAEQSGAKAVYGLDKHTAVLDTVNVIKEMNDSNANFVYWDANLDELTPKCDILLCLNCLHHFPDQEKVLSRLRCKQIICEINNNQIDLVKKYFSIIKIGPSNRKDRITLLGEKLK